MALKKGDFIEIEYTAIDKESGKIFDLTSKELAKKEGVFNPKGKYGAFAVCLGEKHILPGLDEELIGKDVGKEYVIEVSPEKGFGKKDMKLMKIVPTAIFKKQQITPYPGLQINMDGIMGIVRTVSGGRTIMDFNHPLAGHHLEYKIKVNKIITDSLAKLKSLIDLSDPNAKISLQNNEATTESQIANQSHKVLEEKIKKLIPSIKKVYFKKTNTKK